MITPRKELPPLLLKLSERRAERLDYLGVSYGLTTQLLKYDSFTQRGDERYTRYILEGLTVIDAVSFVCWQVLEEGRLHSCVPQTNPCEWKQRVCPRHFVVSVKAANVCVCGCVQNDLTGEHSCVMLKELNTDEEPDQSQWLSAFWKGKRATLY